MKTSIGVVQAACMLLAGIFTGLQFGPPFWLSAVLFTAGLAGGIFFSVRGREFELDQLPQRIARAFFSLMIFAAGMGRTALIGSTQPSGSVESFAGQKVRGLTGYIFSPPVVSNSRTTLRVRIDPEQPEDDLPNEGRILLIFYRDPGTEFRYGDRLVINGTVSLPADSGSSFSYRTYLERDGITAMINNPSVEVTGGFAGNRVLAVIYRLRSILLDRVYRLFPKPENALMAGILLGDESKITSSVERDFQKTGTAHIIAISGANFTVLTWLLLSILRRFVPHWWAPLLMVPFIIFYTILVGNNSAVVRAAIMCALSILGSVLGRTGNGINNLSLTAALMCLWKPLMIYDLGFQLSVTATLGILLFSAPLCDLIRGILAKVFPKMSEEALTAAVKALNDLCLMSISAQIFTTWVSAQAFGQISLISLPANFLIAPFQSLIMLGGFAALLLSFIFYPLGAAAAWLVWAAPALTIRIVQYCAGIKWGAVYFDLPPFQAWLVIGIILALWSGRYLLLNSVRTGNFRPYAAMLLLFLTVMIWANAYDRLNERAEITFRQTASSTVLTVRSSGNHYFIIGDDLTNYSAQDLIEKQILPVPRVIEAAWLDLRENWMQKEFLSSAASDDLSVFYLNGQAKTDRIPGQLEDGFVFSRDDITLRYVTDYLGKRCWTAESGGIELLFPNGVPPERIFTRYGPDLSEISLVILGKRDAKDLWEEYRTAYGDCPQFRDFSDIGEVTLIVKKGRLSYQK